MKKTLSKNMSYLVVCCFLIVLPYDGFMQSFFEINFTTPDRAMVVDGVETQDGDFIFLINNLAYIPGHSHPTLIKTDQQGNLLKTYVIDYYDFIMLSKILSAGDCSYYILGVFASYPDLVYDSLYLSEWTLDLELIRYTEMALPFNDYASLQAAIINSDDQIVLTGSKVMPPAIQSYIYLIDDQFNLLNQVVFNQSANYTRVHSIIEFSNSGLNGYLISLSGVLNSDEGLAKLDSDFNIIEYFSLNPHLNNLGNTTLAKFSDSMYIVTGKFTNTQISLNDIKSLKMDINYNILATNLFGKEPDTIDFPGFLNATAIIDNDNIFISGTSNMNIPQFPYASTPSWFILNKVNGDLDLQWQKFYGGDAHYSVYSIIPSSDGGCVMLGTRYHPNNPTGIDGYILKVGPDGLVSVPEIPGGLQVKEVIVYPNPGSSQLQIQTGHDDLEIMIFDATGKIMTQEKIRQFYHIIPTNAWPSGIYIYRITRNNELFESGKWVKAE